MLKRAWYLMAILWALLLLALGATEGALDQWKGGPWLTALGPLAVPAVLRWTMRFVVTGRLPDPRPQPRVYRTHR